MCALSDRPYRLAAVQTVPLNTLTLYPRRVTGVTIFKMIAENISSKEFKNLRARFVLNVSGYLSVKKICFFIALVLRCGTSKLDDFEKMKKNEIFF
jgi:hypothetical protein